MSTLAGRVAAGETLIGLVSSLPDPFAAEVLGQAGFDWICLDLQHGMATPVAQVGLLQAFGLSATPVLVRVPWNEPSAIMRALDSGAAGVIVPMVNSALEAEAAVAASHYPPRGIRSWGPTRAALGRRDYTASSANDEIICAIMIETRRALEAIDEIVAVPGVDAVFVGPSDLAVDLGAPPSLAADRPEITAALVEIADRALAHDVCPAIFTAGREAAVRLRGIGYRMLTVGSDRLLMLEGALALSNATRAGMAPTPAPSQDGAEAGGPIGTAKG